MNLLFYNMNLFFRHFLMSSGYFSPTPELALGKLDSHYRACTEPHILLTCDSNLKPSFVKVMYLCVLKVEISYPTHAYYNIMPNQMLENLYENNAKALGIQFPEQPANFSGSWKYTFQDIMISFLLFTDSTKNCHHRDFIIIWQVLQTLATYRSSSPASILSSTSAQTRLTTLRNTRKLQVWQLLSTGNWFCFVSWKWFALSQTSSLSRSLDSSV